MLFWHIETCSFEINEIKKTKQNKTKTVNEENYKYIAQVDVEAFVGFVLSIDLIDLRIRHV